MNKNIIIIEVIKVSCYVGSFDPYGDNIIQGLVFPVVYQKSGYFFLTCHGSKYPVAQWLSLKGVGYQQFQNKFQKVKNFANPYLHQENCANKRMILNVWIMLFQKGVDKVSVEF